MKRWLNESMICDFGFAWFEGAEIPSVTRITRGLERLPILDDPEPIEIPVDPRTLLITEALQSVFPSSLLSHQIPRLD